LTPV
jgi:hypothetical protein